MLTAADFWWLLKEPHMKTERLKTIVSLARLMARQDIRLAAEYLRDQGLGLGLARHILRKSMRRPA